MTATRLLFHRDFAGYTGGHGKVWDYFNHALALGLDARVYLTPRSLRDASNPWMSRPERIEREWRPELADALFLAGMDWAAVPPEGPGGDRPVVNLVQHVRHAREDPELPLRRFLPRSAHRICVSRAVADAILATGAVRGPVTVIPAALDLAGVRALAACEDPDEGEALPPAVLPVLVGALKAPALGRAVRDALAASGIVVELIDGWLPRPRFLARLARARATVLLPHAEEGFFLPGLEAMALGRPLVMPFCTGSDQYARDRANCLVPAPDADAIAASVRELLADASLAATLVRAGLDTAQRHDLAAERRSFAAVMAQVLAPPGRDGGGTRNTD